MNRIRMTCAAAGLALSIGGGAEAGVLWQGTFSADPSGVTSVSPHDTPVLPLQDLFLTVTGGSFDAVHWASWDNYRLAWWEFVPDHGWILSGNEYFVTDVGAKQLRPDLAIFRNQPLETYDNCATAPKINFQTCAVFDLGGSVVFSDAVVEASNDFTLTLSDQPPPGGIPEPSTWALLVLGFGGLGALLRRNRRNAGTACAQP